MTMVDDSSEPFLSRADRRRLQVTDAARKLFAENGFHATGMAQIAKESGVAVGQIYRDFASKEDIVADIVNADCCQFMTAETLRVAIHRGDEDAVLAWVHRFLTPDDEGDDNRLIAEIFAEATRNDRVAAIFTSLNDDMRAQMLSAITMLAPGDAFADRRSVLVDTILTLSLGLLHHQLLRHDLAIDPLTRALIAMVDREIASLRLAAALIDA